MSDLQDALAQIKARAEKATEGPWEIEGSLIGSPHYAVGQAFGIKWRDDLPFIAAARTDVPRLVAAVEAVLDELATQRSEADALMERGESNRATEIRRSAGLVLGTLTDKLTEGDPS